MPHQKLSREWPPALRQNADVHEWRLSEAEKAIDQINERHAIPSIPSKEAIGYGLLLILGLSGHLSPETIKAVAFKLLGWG